MESNMISDQVKVKPNSKLMSIYDTRYKFVYDNSQLQSLLLASDFLSSSSSSSETISHLFLFIYTSRTLIQILMVEIFQNFVIGSLAIALRSQRLSIKKFANFLNIGS